VNAIRQRIAAELIYWATRIHPDTCRAFVHLVYAKALRKRGSAA
jgi:hypothetical protein